MTKREFMHELESRLNVIPKDERIDAIGYYEDYFAEAEITDDMIVPDNVGTPSSIAKQIIEELSDKTDKEPYIDENANVKENTENVPYYKARKYSDQNETKFEGNYYDGTARNDGYRSGSNSDFANDNTGMQYHKGTDNTNKIIMLVLLIVSSPIWIGFVAAAIGMLIAALVTLASLVFAFAVAGVSLLVAACFTGGMAGAMILVGCGLLSLALAFIILIPLVLFCIRFLPWLIREIVSLCKRGFGRKEQA